MATRLTISDILQNKKDGKKLACLACYDYITALLLDQVGIDMIIVGDSLGMLALGHLTSSEVTVDEMLHHTKAVRRGARRTLVVADLPFLSYQIDMAEAIKTAGRFIKEAGADAVKMEGSTPYDIELVSRLVSLGIPVMGHIGCVPQPKYAGERAFVRTTEDAERLLDSAILLQGAGAFSLALETVPEPVARLVSRSLRIPTIGYGSGSGCDGQTYKTDNLLNRSCGAAPRFGKAYADFTAIFQDAVKLYMRDVKDGAFPSVDPMLSFDTNEEEAFQAQLDMSPKVFTP